MNGISTSLLESIISERAGLRLRPRQREALGATLQSRLSALGVVDEGNYCQLLEQSEAEWQFLISRLTNKESYFFRDKGQMALLREHILPEIIERNKSSRTLRIWSAGCATGEEAYSLAMIVNELLPRRTKGSGRAWHISILGTDIDETALEFARRGRYGAWSFRTLDPQFRDLHFAHRHEGWQILESSKSLVSFETCNLTSDDFPSSGKGIEDMDLILCRNVFIYFHPKAVSAVLGKFARTLRPGGILMTGHVETRGLPVEPLTVRKFPHSEVYQRPVATLAVTPSPPIRPTSLFISSQRPTTQVKEPRKGEVEAPVKLAALDREELLLSCAREFADKGQYAEAIECCRMISEEFPFSAEAYSLRASIAQDQGSSEEAKLLLKKALYLSPESPHIHMELGALYGSEGDVKRAESMNIAALKLLEQLPPDSTVGYGKGPNAGECIAHLKETASAGV